ncbi:LysR substrate-binding domain-containing protein [Shinella sp.]|uniref:LysR substrate-binding domain-containing protein n=1 Tax=Shinella sp. TaxID=1870904 RepID=UPI0029BCDDB3|nr:LysR substrate-binding domain-containing protein [Shinella sp.]MDX3973579.1 LysR substrate-binding domain-containing protein [Shinella sp.]
MDRLGAMSLLIDVVDSGSFSAAARRLGVPLTTVARKISDLEAALGAKLLVRTTRKLSLTDAGVTYLTAARRIIDQVDEAEREVSGEFTAPKGELVITAPVQFGQLHVLPIVADFLDQFPDINIRLLLLDRNVQLVEDHVDMAVRIGRLPDSAMIATTVGSMRTVICASPELFAVHGIPQTVAALQEMPCIVFDGPGSSANWRLTDPQTKASTLVPMAPRLSVTTVEAAIRAALLHVGVIRLFQYQVADAVKAGSLRIVLEPFEPEPAPVNVVHVARGQMPLKMRSFLDFALPRLRRRLLEFQGASVG